MTPAFATLIEHEGSELRPISGLAKIIPRDTITPLPPSARELDDLQWGSKMNGPISNMTTTNGSLSQTPRELEDSNPATPNGQPTFDAIVQSATNPPRNRWRLGAAGVLYALMGLSDAAAGAVIPYMEIDYNIGYALVSMIFVANAAGFILAAPFVQTIDCKLGRARSYLVAMTIDVIAYSLLVAGLPFPVTIIAFLLIGFATGVSSAMTSLFVVNLLNGTVILGIMVAFYGIGGIVSPIIATNMIAQGAKWSYFYAIPLSLSVISLFFLGWAFRGFEEDAAVQLLTALERTASRRAAAQGEPNNWELLKRALSERTTLLGALFILFYSGAEVAISGWVISFLITYRQGDPSKVGNVTSGFWGGITLGRLLITPLVPRIGERVAVAIMVIVTAALQLIVWLVPNIIGVAVAESLVGLALGPVFPCATAVLSKLLPHNIQIPALAFVTSMGSSGGALIPLITGLMAQKLGTVVLHPIVLVSCAILMGAWLCLPKVAKRSE